MLSSVLGVLHSNPNEVGELFQSQFTDGGDETQMSPNLPSSLSKTVNDGLLSTNSLTLGQVHLTIMLSYGKCREVH